MPVAPPSRNPARRIVLIYTLAASAWILFSDRAVAFLSRDVHTVSRLSILKGWAFVAVTALLLHHFIRRSFEQEREIRAGLAASEARFAKAFQANPAALAITRESDGLFVDANAQFCALVGLPRERLLGHRALDLGLYAVPPDRERILEALRREGAVREVEWALCTASGQTREIRLAMERIQLEGESCLLSTCQDLTALHRQETEQKRLEAEVAHAQKLESLGTLAGGVAHDMNNILGAVMGVASLVQARNREDPRLQKDMDILLKAAARGRDLVRGLTDFARKGIPEATATDLNDLLRQEADLLRRTTLRRIDVALDLEEGLPRVHGDASALSNAIMNLCVNAVDAMPQGGHLTLASRTSLDGLVQVAIRDTGLGMPPEVLRRATEPFFTTKPQGQGTGLGLSLAYSIAKAHGGRLELDSEVGEGTTVRVVLPALGSAHGPEAAPVPCTPPGPATTLDVLLVDDDDLLQGTVPAMLQALGHRPVVAASGAEALARLASGPPPDLLVLDVNMPGMDGFEVLRRLRSRHPRLPVLIVSGLKDGRLDRLLPEDPAVAFLPKPFTVTELGTRVAALVGRP